MAIFRQSSDSVAEKEIDMASDKSKMGRQERDRINLNEDY
jgi:hypothetical protein